jgi:hypothetical protein
MLPMLQFRLT